MHRNTEFENQQKNYHCNFRTENHSSSWFLNYYLDFWQIIDVRLTISSKKVKWDILTSFQTIWSTLYSRVGLGENIKGETGAAAFAPQADQCSQKSWSWSILHTWNHEHKHTWQLLGKIFAINFLIIWLFPKR